MANFPLQAGSAPANTPTPFALAHARHAAALAHFNALPEDLENDRVAFKHEEEAYAAASGALDEATPGDWGELVLAMEHLIGGGADPGRELKHRLVADARRLLDAPPIMSAVDVARLDDAMTRVDQCSTTLDLLSEHADAQGAHMHATAMRGIGSTLRDQMEQIDEVLEPHRRALGAV